MKLVTFIIGLILAIVGGLLAFVPVVFETLKIATIFGFDLAALILLAIGIVILIKGLLARKPMMVPAQ
jgi:hypothetical protein